VVRSDVRAAAIAATCLSTVDPDDHVVASEGIYGGRRVLLEELVVDSIGATVEYVDAVDTGAVDAAVRDDTALVWMESPTNPLLALCDLSSVAEIAAAVDATYVVDNTFATPYFQRPLEYGADAVVHSTTKYLNGHSDSMGGFVVTDDGDVADAVSRVQAYGLGGPIAPFDAYLTLRGLRTFPLRMERHEANAREIAAYLADHPATMSASYLSAAERAAAGIPDSLVRIPVGLEHVDDLIADLDDALRDL
jgi:cystathionine beta-lyase/cystathionine gamma-synthase